MEEKEEEEEEVEGRRWRRKRRRKTDFIFDLMVYYVTLQEQTMHG